MEEKRRKIIVDRKIQFKYMGIIVLILIFFAIVLSISNYAIVSFVLRVSQLGPYAEARFYQVYNRMVYLIIIEVIIFLILSAIVSFFVSHRFAGPIWRIKDELRKIREGGIELRSG